MFAIQYHPDVIRRDLKKIDPHLQRRILNQIQKKLTVAPQEYGKPLQYVLKGYWRLRIEDYRVVYEINSKKETVTIWLVDQRKDDMVYIEFLKRLGCSER